MAPFLSVPVKYQKVIVDPTSSAEIGIDLHGTTPVEIIGRFRLSIDAFGTRLVRLQEQSILDQEDTTNTPPGHTIEPTPLLGSHEDLCVLGGVCWTLERFVRQDIKDNICQYLGVHLGLALVLLMFLIPMFMAYFSMLCSDYDDTDGNTTAVQNDETTIVTDGANRYICQDTEKAPLQTVAFCLCIVALHIGFFGLLILTKRCITDWEKVEARIDGVLQELWEELRSQVIPYLGIRRNKRTCSRVDRPLYLGLRQDPFMLMFGGLLWKKTR